MREPWRSDVRSASSPAFWPGVATRLLSVDTSARALAEARRDCADLDHVMFRLASLPEDFPDGTFDLIVLSEVLYYLSRTDLVRVAAQCAKALTPDGEIVLCHWLGETNYPSAATRPRRASSAQWLRGFGQRNSGVNRSTGWIC